MTRLTCGALAVGSFGAAGSAVAFGQFWWPVPVVAGLVAMWPTVRGCRHPHPSLLPPLPDEGPDRDHARWYCDECGRTWAASFRAETRPTRRYVGFDQSKAAIAAARANVLERQRRRLALERAGMPARPKRATAEAQAAPRQELAPGPRPIGMGLRPGPGRTPPAGTAARPASARTPRPASRAAGEVTPLSPERAG